MVLSFCPVVIFSCSTQFVSGFQAGDGYIVNPVVRLEVNLDLGVNLGVFLH